MLERLDLICKEAMGTPEKKMKTGKTLMIIGAVLIVISYAIPYLVR